MLTYLFWELLCIFIIMKLITNLMHLDRNECLLMYYAGSWSYFGCSFLKRGTKALTQHRPADGWWTIWSICRQTQISRLGQICRMLDRNMLGLVVACSSWSNSFLNSLANETFAAATKSDRTVARGGLRSCGCPGEQSSPSALPVCGSYFLSVSSLMVNTKAEEEGGGVTWWGRFFLVLVAFCGFC